MNVTVSFGESAWASCDLLLFAQGRRLVGPRERELVWLSYGESGWSSGGWAMDEHGEWESHQTVERWGAELDPRVLVRV